MVELIQALLLFLVVALSLFGIGFTEGSSLIGWIRLFAEKRRLTIVVIGGATLLGCVATAGASTSPCLVSMTNSVTC